jgi:hypothetical protein
MAEGGAVGRGAAMPALAAASSANGSNRTDNPTQTRRQPVHLIIPLAQASLNQMQ